MAIGLLIVRLVVGLTIAAHGAQKLFAWFGGYGPDRTGQFMEALGFRPGRRQAVVAGLVEFGGGLLLALGLATPLGATLIASVMLVATVSAHLNRGFFVMSGGYEYNLVLGAAAVSLAFTGPGGLSIDARLGYSFAGNLWGVTAILAALSGAVAQLAQRQAAPAGQDTRTAA